MKELENFKDHSLPRWIGYDPKCTNFEIHAYSDASFQLYATCVYFVFHKDNFRHLSFICAKSRLAPKSGRNTIPRLELLGTLLSARLVNSVIIFIPTEISHKVKCFTDSSVALNWIKGTNKTFEKFIQRRVEEIRTLVETEMWFHVSGKFNPADLATRCIATKKILNESLWWSGHSSNDVISSFKYEPEDTHTSDVFSVGVLPNDELIDLKRFSVYQKLIKTMKFIIKFCKSDQNAETVLYKMSPNLSYKQEILDLKANKQISKQSSLYQLNPFLDQHGLLRVTGRLSQSEYAFNIKHSIIHSNICYLTLLIIKFFHTKNLHAGISTLCSLLRKEVWIPKCRKTCKQIISRCIKCQRYKSKPCEQKFDQLPLERIAEFNMKPFQYTGVDYLGPIASLLEGTKLYVALFTCMQIRAIHLEVTNSLSFNEFSKAFSRFVSRRGIPTQVRSDNAKTFKAPPNNSPLLIDSLGNSM